MRPQERYNPGTFSIRIKGTHYEGDGQRFRQVIKAFREQLKINGFIVGAKDRPEKFTPSTNIEEALPVTTRAEAAKEGLDRVPPRRTRPPASKPETRETPSSDDPETMTDADARAHAGAPPGAEAQ